MQAFGIPKSRQPTDTVRPFSLTVIARFSERQAMASRDHRTATGVAGSGRIHHEQDI